MKHSLELREAVVRKALVKEMGQEAIAKEFGVSRSTVQNWLRQHRLSGAKQVTEVEKRPQDWTAEERFSAVMETHGMSGAELGVWCRQHGLHTHQLEQWRRDAMSGSSGGRRREEQAELKRLRQQNQQLKKDLRRKEKALAETSALLVLKKKADLIWGDEEDD
jgi:transposase-like protein